MVGILKLLLFLIIVIVLLTAFGLHKLFRGISDTINNLNQSGNGGNGNADRHGDRSNSKRGTYEQKQTKNKIFSDGEGEYVDYKEVE